MIVIVLAIISVALLIGLSIFQILLAVGLPFGRFAYGGKYETLPKNLRIMSIIAIGIYIFASISVLAKAGIIFITDFLVFEIAVWIFAIYLAFNTLTNLGSKSKSEKFVMTPISLTLAVSLFIIAIAA
ncbi:MAG: hypothetical protein ACW972_10505 [Promethearchaeota archaeon]|jgi:hypothetical protein